MEWLPKFIEELRLLQKDRFYILAFIMSLLAVLLTISWYLN